MGTISARDYLLDQARRRLTPTLNNMPGMGYVEKRLLNHDWKQIALADPPPGSGLKPVTGDNGLPVFGHIIEMFRAPTRRRPSSPTGTRTTRRRAGTRSSGRSSIAG